ncbi:hypothetical protein B0H11DRAFT_1960854 [Mycena galericulata]|nr:hypothetical protein B0H11DRAFT_1960854 [Mycena galericulata]
MRTSRTLHWTRGWGSGWNWNWDWLQAAIATTHRSLPLPPPLSKMRTRLSRLRPARLLLLKIIQLSLERKLILSYPHLGLCTTKTTTTAETPLCRLLLLSIHTRKRIRRRRLPLLRIPLSFRTRLGSLFLGMLPPPLSRPSRLTPPSLVPKQGLEMPSTPAQAKIGAQTETGVNPRAPAPSPSSALVRTGAGTSSRLACLWPSVRYPCTNCSPRPPGSPPPPLPTIARRGTPQRSARTRRRSRRLSPCGAASAQTRSPRYPLHTPAPIHIATRRRRHGRRRSGTGCTRRRGSLGLGSRWGWTWGRVWAWCRSLRRWRGATPPRASRRRTRSGRCWRRTGMTTGRGRTTRCRRCIRRSRLRRTRPMGVQRGSRVVRRGERRGGRVAWATWVWE